MNKIDAKVLGIILNDVNAKSYNRRAHRGKKSSYYASRYEKNYAENIYQRAYKKEQDAKEGEKV